MKYYIIDKIFIKMQDDIKIADSEYLSAKKKSYEIEKDLMTSLSDNQKQKIKELTDNLATIAYEESKLNFCNGFKMGAKLILELLF